jgi:hypothetical protein
MRQRIVSGLYKTPQLEPEAVASLRDEWLRK